MTTSRFHALASLILFAVGASHAEAQQRFEFSELHMGVEVRMVLYTQGEAQARGAARAGFDRIAALEDKMSDYRAKSEIRSLERRTRKWLRVSEPLFNVLKTSVEVASTTDGAFDPTVGPLVALWREARRLTRMPNPAQLEAARTLVGWRLIGLDSANRRVRLARRGMHIDLGGIAKGYAVQQAAFVLRDHGVASALVEAGGDIAVTDAPPGQMGWRIEAQRADSAVQARAAALTNAAISTSGPSAQFVEIDGRRYSHVVDPRTGIALTSAAQATVIAVDGAVADALSTALTVLDARAASRVLARYPDVLASVDRQPRVSVKINIYLYNLYLILASM